MRSSGEDPHVVEDGVSPVSLGELEQRLDPPMVGRNRGGEIGQILAYGT